MKPLCILSTQENNNNRFCEPGHFYVNFYKSLYAYLAGNIKELQTCDGRNFQFTHFGIPRKVFFFPIVKESRIDGD